MTTYKANIFGQSNPFGYALLSTLDPTYQQAFPEIQIQTAAGWEDLDYSINNNQYPGTPTNCGSIEFALGYALQQWVQDTVFITKYAVPDTGLGTTSTQNWNVNTRGSYFDKSRGFENKGMVDLWADGHREFDVTDIWFAGEKDCKSVSDAFLYQSNLEAFALAKKASQGSSVKRYRFICIKLADDLFQTDTKNTISACTNADPSVATAAAAHGQISNAHVEIKDSAGNTAINGEVRCITVVNSTNYSVPVAGNGTYTANSAKWSPFPYRATINIAIDNLVKKYPDWFLAVDVNGLDKDSGGVHFPFANGYDVIGTDCFDTIKAKAS